MQVLALLPGAARTAAENGAAQELSAGLLQMAVHLNITAASGTSPSLTVTVEDSADGVVWVTHTAFAAKTGVGSDALRLDKLARYVLARCAISGTTPSFTFSVQAVGR